MDLEVNRKFTRIGWTATLHRPNPDLSGYEPLIVRLRGQRAAPSSATPVLEDETHAVTCAICRRADAAHIDPKDLSTAQKTNTKAPHQKRWYYRCRLNMAHVRQSRPYSGYGFQEGFQVVGSIFARKRANSLEALVRFPPDTYPGSLAKHHKGKYGSGCRAQVSGFMVQS